MTDTPRRKWFTTQMRVSSETHDYLKREAAKSHISITQAAGVLLDYCRREGLEIGPVVITPAQPAVVTPVREQHGTG